MSSRPIFLVTTALLALVLLALPLAGQGTAPPAVLAASPPDSTAMPDLPASQPVFFVENTGQWPAPARFQAWGTPLGPGTTWLTQDALWITIVEGAKPERLRDLADRRPSQRPAYLPRTGIHLRISFPGANPQARMEPFGSQDTTVSYLRGRETGQWRSQVPLWTGVRYVNIYPGIDLEITGEGGRWHWRWVAHPDARQPGPGQDSPAAATPAVKVEGANTVVRNNQNICLTTVLGVFNLPLPQGDLPLQVEGHVPGKSASECSLSLATARSTDDDPGDLVYATFVEGTGIDEAHAIAVDGTGRAYVAGWTHSSDFPATPGAFDISHNGEADAFVLRLSADGSALEYATFLGGSAGDEALAIVVDSDDRALVAGHTASGDFPATPDAVNDQFGGVQDGFMARLSADGKALEYATFLGGSDEDAATGIALHSTGQIMVGGWTYSSNFPTTPGAYGTTFNGIADAFVARLSLDDSQFDYATLVGGTDYDLTSGFTIDPAGRAYITGWTDSANFPTTSGAFDTSLSNDLGDVFVARLNASGSDLEYGTYLGGIDTDEALTIAADDGGHAFVAGETYSVNFPTTPGAFDTEFELILDGFVVRLNADGSDLDYATFLGGDEWDSPRAIAVDDTGQAVVVGDTLSFDFPTSQYGFDTSYNGSRDGFLVRLNSDGSDLAYGTFLGGTSRDRALAVALGGVHEAYVAGWTDSTDFPTVPWAFDSSLSDTTGAWVAHLEADNVAPPPTKNLYLPMIVRQ